MSKIILIITLFTSLLIGAMGQSESRMKTGRTLPPGYWPLEKSQPLIDKTQTIRLTPELSQLSENERKAVNKLLAVGQIFQRLYEDQRHKQALDSIKALAQLDKRLGSIPATQNLLMLYRLNQGPIATTLENKREPFLPVDPTTPGKTVFPWGVKKDEIEAILAAHPEQRDQIMDARTDYESGDAAWVTGRFKNLNAQIGSYETYDDELYGVKTFFGLSMLLMRTPETTALRQAMKGMQALEDSLPYDHHKRIREDIPVGVYDVIADFGQTRGGNTATILPNESYLARRYGRTILLRANIMRDANIFSSVSGTLAAAVGQEQAGALTPDGNFYRTLWHEVGHYLGVDRTKDNRELDDVLQEDSSVLEEMKADLVSLFVAEPLRKQGYYTDAQLRSVYAGGILRVLQNNKPRRDQPYNTMQLMQWNFFLENGLLSFKDGKLQVHYDKYHNVVGKMLAKTLDVQYEGDKAAADRFIEQYTNWDDNLHGLIAKNIRDQQRYRFRLFKYAVLGE